METLNKMPDENFKNKIKESSHIFLIKKELSLQY